MTWIPTRIQLSTDVNRRPIASLIELRALQTNPSSSSQPEDYHVAIHSLKTGDVVPPNRSIGDHDQLYRHFLDMLRGYPDYPDGAGEIQNRRDIK